MWMVVVPTFVAVALAIFGNYRRYVGWDILFWVVVLGGVELLPVPVSKVLHLSVGFPIRLGVSILYPAPVAAAVALVGSCDRREIDRTISPLKAAFNRSQITASTYAGALVFHALANVTSPLYRLVPSALLATTALYASNLLLVSAAMRLLYGVPIRQLMGQLRMGALHEFLLNYMGLALVGIVLARLYDNVGVLSVAAFVLPLIFARQMFFRTMALQAAHQELQERQQVLKALSNRMAEERQDERMHIAAYLHDDLAQMLFRLSLQAEMAKKRLATGDSTSAIRDIDGILRTKQETSDAIRALIRDLHRSPIGRRGLAEAIESFAEDMSRGAPTRVVPDVIEVSLPPPIQLLIYQIAREATMNALKHAEAEEIRISLAEAEHGVVLTIQDDGKGFDTSAPPPEGHFGSVMMRERALVAGGTYSLTSEPGKGTTITASFPQVWVEEGTELEAGNGPSRGETGASPKPPVGATVGPPTPAVAPNPWVGHEETPASDRPPSAGEPVEPVARSLKPVPQPVQASPEDHRRLPPAIVA
jgi:signal transduction histidine kinase